MCSSSRTTTRSRPWSRDTCVLAATTPRSRRLPRRPSCRSRRAAARPSSCSTSTCRAIPGWAFLRRRLPRRRRLAARLRRQRHGRVIGAPARVRSRGLPAQALRHADPHGDRRAPRREPEPQPTSRLPDRGTSMLFDLAMIAFIGIACVLPLRPGLGLRLVGPMNAQDLLGGVDRPAPRDLPPVSRSSARRSSDHAAPPDSSRPATLFLAVLAVTPFLGGYMRPRHRGRADLPLAGPSSRRARHLPRPRRGRGGRAALDRLRGLGAASSRSSASWSCTCIQRLQGVLPLDQAGLGPVAPDLALNTAVSFVTNTNWQNYAGETTMTHLTQMAGLAVQNFVSAAVGIAVAIALTRGLVRRSSPDDRQLLGGRDPSRSCTSSCRSPSSPPSSLVSQGVIQTFERPVDRHHPAGRARRRSRSDRSPRRRRSRSSATTAAASSTPTPPTRSRTRTRSRTGSRCSSSSSSRSG